MPEFGYPDEFSLPIEWPEAHPVIWKKLNEHEAEIARQSRDIESRTQERVTSVADLSAHVDTRFDTLEKTLQSALSVQSDHYGSISNLQLDARNLRDNQKNTVETNNLALAGFNTMLEQILESQAKSAHASALQFMLNFVLAAVILYLVLTSR